MPFHTNCVKSLSLLQFIKEEKAERFPQQINNTYEI